MTKQAIENVEKVKHDNIYAALSAFQGEELTIKKTKQFGKDDDRMKFMYASLDDVLDVVRPLTSKHGLSFTWESAGEGKIQCVLYHETFKPVFEESFEKDGVVTTKKTPESNVLRSAPITVARSGDMKTIGNNSTYARRFSLSEVLGVASEEDKDAPIEEESAKNAVKTVFISTKDKISKGDKEYIESIIHLINKELDLIEAKKAPKLGLTTDQYNELGRLAEAKLEALGIKEDMEHEEKAITVE